MVLPKAAAPPPLRSSAKPVPRKPGMAPTGQEPAVAVGKPRGSVGKEQPPPAKRMKAEKSDSEPEAGLSDKEAASIMTELQTIAACTDSFDGWPYAFRVNISKKGQAAEAKAMQDVDEEVSRA